MKNPLAGAEALWKTFGADGIRHRAGFEVRKRFSRLQRGPRPASAGVLESSAPSPWSFTPNTKRLAQHAEKGEAIPRADRVLAGEYQAYRTAWRRRPATPDEWNVDLLTGHRYDASAPWFRVPHAQVGSDIKDAWEPGRFSWAYDLARGWMLTGNDRYAHAFWSAFETFRKGCRPYRGVQWACGQETAVRAIALLWCETALANAPSTTPARQASLREMLYWSGNRISDAIDYAFSQRNNHGISECTGLIAIGARFRHVDATAGAWWHQGRSALGRQVLDQLARDGWYAQHSFTYLRVALDQLVLAERTLRAGGDTLGMSVIERIRAGVRLLCTVIDEETGDVPNHGANDGAFVLPLTTREYRDFRPSLTAAAATFQVPLPSGVEADAEMLAWLDLDSPASSASRPRVMIGESGWLDARAGDSRVFARAGAYRTRPSHIDALHLDVWIGGRVVAADAGTYRYAGTWSRALAEEQAHNTVSVVGFPMAERGPRFLWLRWPRSTISSYHDDGDAVTIEMLNESWRQTGIAHRRTCRIAVDAVVVLDDLSLAPGHPARGALHWLIDGSREDVVVVANVPVEIDVRRGEESSPYGWIADSYAVRRPATSMRATTRDPSTRVRFVSGFGAARSEEYLRSVLTHGVGASPDVVGLAGGGGK